MSYILHQISQHKFAIPVLNRLIKVQKKFIPYQPNNPFLEGMFKPVAQEYTRHELKVIGEIPKQLNGIFLRAGPNPIHVDNPALYNWFVGDGMVHGLKLQDGKALWYKNRYIGTHKVNHLLGRAQIEGQPRGVADISNTNILGHAGKIWSLVEAGAYPIELDFDLNSQAYRFFNTNENLGFTAHPHKDPDTGELHAICYDALNFNQVFYQVVTAEGELLNRVAIPVKHGPMMHDCAMTSKNMLIFDLPITFSFKNLAKGADFPYAWNDKHQARIGVLPKKGSAKDIQWFDVDPCFIFHSCNAFECENGDIILDAAVHTKTFSNTMQGPADHQFITFERWTLVQQTKHVKREIISDIPQEFPRFDERLTGKEYRYAYTITTGEANKPIDAINIEPNKLLKHDLKTGETVLRNFGRDQVSGEVIFIPKQLDSAEDAGWLISYVHDLNLTQTKVVILDAQNICAEPQAIIELGVRVPVGFHSNWVDSISS